MTGGDRRLLGRWGETQTADWLRARGWRVVAAGWRCRFGEIDLIAVNDKYIAFTEVKLRKNAVFAPARAFVDRGKQDGLLDERISTNEYAHILLSTMIGVEILWCFDKQGRSLADMMEQAVLVTARGMIR